MDEFTAVLRARNFVSEVNQENIPVSVESYATQIDAIIHYQTDLEPSESGWCFQKDGKYYIGVNTSDSKERQRFTVCHELGHIVLKITSDHDAPSTWSYAKKSPSEILCDVFAAELLLPYQLFKPIADKEVINFSTIEELASRFEASITATGSRFATAISAPCAFVLSEQGKIRYVSRSLALREANVWIPPRTDLPSGSISAEVRSGNNYEYPEEVDADKWFSDWERGGVLLEEVRHLSIWDQTLTLLWFEDEEIPPSYEEENVDLMGLKELDGILPWPGKKRRKK